MSWSRAPRRSAASATCTTRAILETVIDGNGGTVRIVDFAPRFRRFGRMFRPPMLVRRLEPVAGRPRVTIRLRPTFDYGAHKAQLTSGSNHARFFGDSVGAAAHHRCVDQLRPARDRVLARPAGQPDRRRRREHHRQSRHAGRSFLAETESYWHTWVRDLNIPFDWQQAVIRAAITLKLCSYEDTGAVLAALTTSVPEAPNTPRTWDYRFTWLRDAFFTVTALNRLSATRTMESYVRFIVDVVEAGSSRGEVDAIAPLFPIAPGTDTTERLIDTLAGLSRLRAGAHR